MCGTGLAQSGRGGINVPGCSRWQDVDAIENRIVFQEGFGGVILFPASEEYRSTQSHED